ncbi:MAG: hypothetical protein LBE79_02205 [Tannerella sp.]|jgi:hypothetical protein|nr:hypothetical protein [Tannerella sp.]
MKKYRKMLSDINAPYLQSLMKLIETQSKTTLANWNALLVIAAEECAAMEAALQAVAVENEPNPAKINWNC